MGLEAVKGEVLAGAKNQSSAIMLDAKKEASRIIKEAEKKVEELMERSSQEASKVIESLKRQETASAVLEAKKIVLEAKRQIVEESFDLAKKELDSMDDKERESILRKMLQKAQREIEIGHVHCNKKDGKFLKDLKPQVAEMAGGIIAENKDRTIRVDYSYESLLQTIKETTMQEINQILFD